MKAVTVTFVSVVLIFGLGVVEQSYAAKDYPTRPIELIVPYTPGSTMDLLARLIANTAPKYLGQSVVAVNKPGAGGSMAAADVIGSRPEGYKLMVTTNFFFSMTTKTQKVPFNPNDLVPVANFLEYRNGLIVKGDSPWKTLNDLLDYGRKNPGKLTWSHTGRGISQHMYGLLLFRKANVETTDIPYKGSPEMLTALLGGNISASFMVYGAVADHVRSGAVRYLVTVGERRYSNLPEVPCAPELGFPEVAKLPTYVGLYIHKDTPPEIKKIVLDAMTKTYQDPEFKKGLEAHGEEPKFGGPDFMAAAIRNSEAIAVPILKEFGLYVGGK
ncbi:MAG: tripartite tricarboxylate transporter substrate binding protein [Syntrophales bacterium LBB04]|nr:tripartite tricarboxylate transporter substrate binding protein [Syntrophales bacterium LBB04]